MKKILLALIVFCGFVAMAQDFKWMKTAEFSGSGIMQSQLFDLRGSKWRVKYKSRDNSPIWIEIYSEDGTVKKDMMHATNKQTLSGTQTGVFPYGMNRGYLRIRGSYSGWNVEFEQYVDEIKGWELTRLLKQDVQMEKWGAWSGDASEKAEIPVAMTSKRWRMSFTAQSEGSVKIEVLDKQGKLVSLAYVFEAGKKETWFYKPGEYTVRINATDTAWLFEVDAAK